MERKISYDDLSLSLRIPIIAMWLIFGAIIINVGLAFVVLLFNLLL